MFSARGPDAKKPVILCARHAEILRHNLALIAEDRARWAPDLHPEFDPEQVEIKPSKGFCRFRVTTPDVPCGPAQASMPEG